MIDYNLLSLFICTETLKNSTMNKVSNPFEEILDKLEEIGAAISKLRRPETPTKLSDSLTRDQAIEHLKEKGLPIELSQFYKLTANGTIPSQRIGKRLILSRNELDEWMESQKYRRITPEQRAVLSLANSATKKLERAKQ